MKELDVVVKSVEMRDLESVSESTEDWGEYSESVKSGSVEWRLRPAK
jgi:hypothetical protein